MPSLAPGLTITEISQSPPPVSTGKPDTIVLVCTRTTTLGGAVADNTPVKISLPTEVATKVGTVPTIVQSSVEMIRSIAPNSNLYLIAGNATGTPTQAQKLVAGIQAIKTFQSLPVSFLIIPETTITAVTQADRTLVFNAAEAHAATDGWDWLHFANTSIDTDTKAKAITEKDFYTSLQGNSSLYFGVVKDASARDVPVATIAAAYAVALNQNQAGFYSPAGDNAILPVSTETGVPIAFQPQFSDVADFWTNKINVLWLRPNGWAIWGDYTLSSDNAWGFINSRLASSTIGAWTQEVLGSQQFLPLDQIQAVGDTEGIRSREIFGRVTQVMERAVAEGALGVPPALSDGTIPPPYRIISAPAGSGKVAITIRYYVIRSLREIAITLLNVVNP